MKTVIKKIIKDKQRRAKRIDNEKKEKLNVINIKAIIHRPTKHPRTIPVDLGKEPPCLNWVKKAARGPGARIISGG